MRKWWGALAACAVAAAWLLRPLPPAAPQDVFGKAVLITGASSGIGEEMAVQYASMGARLLLVARREAQLAAVARRCREAKASRFAANQAEGDRSDGPGALDIHTLRVDAAVEADIDAALQYAAEAFGGALDVLLLNHARIPKGQLLGGAVSAPTARDAAHAWREELRGVMAVNVEGSAYFATAALPLLEAADNGQIVVISSASASVFCPFHAAYASSKAALNTFFKTLRNELELTGASTGVSLLSLGLIGTANVTEHVALRQTAMDLGDCASQVIAAGAARVRDHSIPTATLTVGGLIGSALPSLGQLMTHWWYLDRRPEFVAEWQQLQQLQLSQWPLA